MGNKEQANLKVVLIDAELHRDVKARSAQEGISLRQAVTEALRSWLERSASETAA